MHRVAPVKKTTKVNKAQKSQKVQKPTTRQTKKITTKAKAKVVHTNTINNVKTTTNMTIPVATTTIKSKRAFSSSTTFPTFSEGPIVTSLDNEILHVKFNNPKMLNAMNIAMGEKMIEIVDLLKKDNGKTVQAVILSGNGRGFSAGGDLDFLKARSLDTSANNITEMLNFYSRFMTIRQIPVPVIAAINGPCIGAGAAVACLADIRVMSTNASMGWTFLPLGLHPGMGSTHFLPKLTTSPSIATHLLLSGDIIDAGLAKNFGLVHEVVQVDQPDDVELNNQLTLESATILAKHYTKHSSLATFTLLKSLRQQQDEGLQTALQREAFSQALTFASPEFQQSLDKMINRKKK